MTTQSPHLYRRRQDRPAAGSRSGRPPGKAATAQTRLPWWALALPVAAFAILLALLSEGSAQAASPSGGDVFARVASLAGALLRHVM